MRKALLSCLLLFIAIGTSTLYAQPFKKQLNEQNPESHNFFTWSNAFEQWSKTVNLRKTKGWKFYKRWEWENASRIRPDGSSDYMDQYMQAFAQLERKQAQAQNSSSRNTLWTPVGPLQKATTTDTTRNHGQGRINSVTFHPTDPNTLFAASSGGGLWKTTNAGTSWTPMSNGLPLLRVSKMAIAKSNPNTMYLATGDYELVAYSFPNSTFSHYGIGLYKSIDGGNTWLPTSLSFSVNNHPQSMIGDILVDPTNPNNLVVSGFDGIQTSSNGGSSWTTTHDSLIWDLEQDPNNPSTLYATSGYVKNHQQGAAEIYKSIDFGATWTTLNTPIIPSHKDSIIRLELAISPANSNYVYALAVGTDYGLYGVYKSIDGGLNWTQQISGLTLNILGWYDGDPSWDTGGQGWYDLTLIADHNNPDLIHAGGINMWSSSDGGSSWENITYWVNYYGKSVHADHHQIARNPLTNQYFVCSDGGIDRADTLLTSDPFTGAYSTQWTSVSDNIANTQFYRIGLGNASSKVIGGAQDNGTFLKDANWQSVIGGDGMECMIDHQNENIIYGTVYYGSLYRSIDGGQNFSSGLTSSITSTGEQGEWVTPFAMNAENSSSIYAGFGNVWKSFDKGDNWVKISPFDTIAGLGYPQKIREMAVNPLDSHNIYIIKRPIWSMGYDASVWVTTDGGIYWTDISAGLPTSDVYINDVATGNSPDTAWIVCGGIDVGKKVYKTTNGGTSWVNISGTLPNIPINSVVFDRLNDVVYIGSDLGVYYRRANDTDWTLLGTDLPKVIISELEIHYSTNKLYAATYGRGVWMTDLLSLVTSTEPNSIYEASSKVYPNPTNGSFTLELEQLTVGQIKIEVVNVLGSVLHQEQVELNSSQLKKTFDLDLPVGQYYIRILNGKNSLVETVQIR